MVTYVRAAGTRAPVNMATRPSLAPVLRRKDGLYVALQIGYQATKAQANLVIQQFAGAKTVAEHTDTLKPINATNTQPEDDG
jgi:hypothetical protein